MKSRIAILYLGIPAFLVALGLAWQSGIFGYGTARVAIAPTLEDRTSDGSLYNPSTQSLVREHHWLESVEEVKLRTGPSKRGTVSFLAPGSREELSVKNLPMDYLVPRLHYEPASPPDAFDALNLMLAEYSRNSVSVPVGKSGDTMAHFETTLPESAPWTLEGDYVFKPNAFVRPVRVGLINNCLRPGLWEVSASDRSGEIYHGWFEMPYSKYIRLVAKTNRVPAAFAKEALEWRTDAVPVELDRLRAVLEPLGTVPARLSGNTESGFSSQDSRRKLEKGYVMVEKEGNLLVPATLRDLTDNPCHMSPFIEPGKYDVKERRSFDLTFLAGVKSAAVSRVEPRTSYDWCNPRRDEAPGKKGGYVEIIVQLEDHTLQLGNLPMILLVPQADFAIDGFGVGVLSSDGLAERRKYLIEEGPAPSFAYLCQEKDGQLTAVNNHDKGLEQIFIRTHIDDAEPWWEITVTSYERIVDLVKYRVEIPEPLREEMKRYALEYIEPLYLTYRDDNLR